MRLRNEAEVRDDDRACYRLLMNERVREAEPEGCMRMRIDCLFGNREEGRDLWTRDVCFLTNCLESRAGEAIQPVASRSCAPNSAVVVLVGEYQ